MKCPNEECRNTNNFKVYTKLLCATSLFVKDEEVTTVKTEAQEEWTEVEPEYVLCCECEHNGTPEEFGLYTGQNLKRKLTRLIYEAADRDDLGALPMQIMSLVLPQGGVLIYKA